MRKIIVAGNWKMNAGAPEDAAALAKSVVERVGNVEEVEVAVCPPFTAIAAVAEVVRGSKVALGSQNLYPKDSGAYTGEVSGTFLKSLGCSCVILGHSERREYFKETNAFINEKVKAALALGLLPILCVGEKEEEREAGKTEAVVKDHVEGGLAGLSADEAKKIVIAYEPVWAIGTGKTAKPEDAQAVHAFIRGILNEMFGAETGESIRIQYGGSMKPGNAKELLAQPDIDGGLIGGAALKAEDFEGIVRAGI